jgi:hypothetical protein
MLWNALIGQYSLSTPPMHLKGRRAHIKCRAALTIGVSFLIKTKFLSTNSDLILANLLGATHRVSTGVVGELLWANSFDKPVIIIRETFGNVHDHAMLYVIAGHICYSLEERREALGAMLMIPSSLARGAAS